MGAVSKHKVRLTLECLAVLFNVARGKVKEVGDFEEFRVRILSRRKTTVLH